MASSKVMPSSSSRNNNNRNSNHHHRSAKSNDLGSTVDGLLRNVYVGSNGASGTTLLDAEITLLDAAGAVTAISDGEAGGGGSPAIRRQDATAAPAAKEKRKTVDDVWKEIVEGRSGGGQTGERGRECKKEAKEEMMTLEDFLAKAEAAEQEEEDLKPPPPAMTGRLSGGLFSFDSVPASPLLATMSVDGGLGFGRGKRRAVLEPMDKAAQQRQRRMIKNRESAARSRERKQAYQVELESLAVKLGEENERLLKEKAERMKERYKQLMEKVVPLEEKRRPRRVLRRVRSMDW